MSDTPPRARRSRRDFIAMLGASTSAAWLSSVWPSAIARASEAAQSQTPRYRVLTAQQAADFGAIADRIIPPDDVPGARDLGVVFFADQAFAGVFSDDKPEFDKALAAVNDEARKRYPDAASFAALTASQQDEVLQAVEDVDADMFNVLRIVTLCGYFSHPSHGGNRNFAGWKAIGFEDRMEWKPPFGYYDRPEVMARLLPPRRA